MEHIFAKWPRLCDLASDLGKPYQTVSSWKQRGSIPARYDMEIIRAARGRGQRVTLEELAEARAQALPPTEMATACLNEQQKELREKGVA